MPKRRTVFAKGKYYHIYNRGANRQRIFRNPDNYLFLLRKLKKYFIRDRITIIAYCLMPNHYHFLLRQDDDISIADFIQAIFNSYTKAFNKMHNRTGTLFEDRFQSKLVDKEAYLIHLCRYIHRNPIDAETPLVQALEDWPYSNYLEWIGRRNGSLVCHEFIQSYFPNREDYIHFVHDLEPAKIIKTGLKPYLFVE